MNPYKDMVFSGFLFAKELFYTVTLVIFIFIVNEPDTFTEIERRNKYSTPLLLSIGGIVLTGLLQLITNTIIDGVGMGRSLCAKKKKLNKTSSALKD